MNRPLQKGRLDEAAETLRRVVAIEPDSTWSAARSVHGLLGAARAHRPDRREWGRTCNSSFVQVGANPLSGTCATIPTTEDQKRRQSVKCKAIVLAGVTAAVSAVPSFAHHSFAMFDAEKTMTLEGTVKEFQWTNPHSWILLTVNNAQGRAEQWAIEMGGPSGLARQGWVPKTLTPGMKVQTIIHPLRDGSPGGQFMAVTLPDGTVMGNPNARAGANAGAGP